MAFQLKTDRRFSVGSVSSIIVAIFDDVSCPHQSCQDSRTCSALHFQSPSGGVAGRVDRTESTCELRYHALAIFQGRDTDDTGAWVLVVC